MRTGIYTRVSQARGKNKGKSTGDQELECRGDLADNIPAAIVTAVYTDDDRGASRYSKKERPDWKRLLDDLQAGRLDMLCTWEHSRTQRDLEAYVQLRRACRETNTLWRYDGRTYDLNDDTDSSQTAQDAVDAEKEAGRIRKRSQRGVRTRARNGHPHGRVLYGYRKVYDPETGGYLHTEPDEADDKHPGTAPVVREIYRRATDQAAGPASIAAHLTRTRVPTATGNVAWQPSAVRNILTNEGYLGRRVSRAGHATVENAWPALVDETTWWRAQVRFIGDRAPRQDPTVKHLLSGIARCGKPRPESPGGVCGAGLGYNSHANDKRRQGASYDCSQRHCVGRAAEPMEAQVVEFVFAMYDDDRVGRRPESDPRIADADRDLRALEAQLKMWHDSSGTPDGPSPAAVAQAERNLTTRIRAAERQLSGLRARYVLPDLKGRTLREAWHDEELLPLATKRAIIAASVTISVLPAGRGRRIYDPATVVVTRRW